MAEGNSATASSGTKDRSTIKFPYGDLDDAVDVARKIHEKFGLSATVDQVAAALGQSLSGAFRAKMASAGTFGVVESGRGEVHLTDLGARIADPQTEQSARVEAFLGVPLYSKVFERFRGTRLPGDSGFESELVKFGVAPKAAAKARQTLQRSADQAGFFSQGRDRLVQPASRVIAGPSGDEPTATRPEHTSPREATHHEIAPALARHPLLVGLWQELPDPAERKLSPEQQENWIETAKLVLRLLYSGDGPRLTPGLTFTDRGDTTE